MIMTIMSSRSSPCSGLPPMLLRLPRHDHHHLSLEGALARNDSAAAATEPLQTRQVAPQQPEQLCHLLHLGRPR